MLVNVTPPSSTLNLRDKWLSDAIVNSNHFLRARVTANGPYIGIGEFGVGPTLSTATPITGDHIRHVLRVSSPIQMRWVCTGWVVASVAGFGFWGLRSSVQNQRYRRGQAGLTLKANQGIAVAIEKERPTPTSTAVLACQHRLQVVQQGIVGSLALNKRIAVKAVLAPMALTKTVTVCKFAAIRNGASCPTADTLRHIGPPVRIGRGRGVSSAAGPLDYKASV